MGRTSTFNPSVFFALVDRGRSAAQYAKDAVVYSQAAIADGVYYLREGKVKLSVASQGKGAIIAILDPGSFFGEGCLIGDDMRSASAVAMVDSKVMQFTKAEMLRLLREEPAFDELFIRHLLTRNSRVEEDLVDQLLNSSEKRLARALLLLANVQEGGMPQQVATKVSQETLAELIGTTRPRVSHFMTKFRKLGFISGANGNLRVHSSLLNVVLEEPLVGAAPSAPGGGILPHAGASSDAIRWARAYARGEEIGKSIERPCAGPITRRGVGPRKSGDR